MDTKLLAYGSLGIPEALISAHEELCEELARATAEPGQIGKVAKQVEELCVPHFAKEEETIFRVFGLLHDLATERVRPDVVVALPIISELRARRDMDHHKLINAAIEELLQQARKEKNKTIARIARALRDHENAEDEVMYPTIVAIGQSTGEPRNLAGV